MQMGSMFKQGMFDAYIQGLILDWAKGGRRGSSSSHTNTTNGSHRMISQQPFDAICVAQQSFDDEPDNLQQH